MQAEPLNTLNLPIQFDGTNWDQFKQILNNRARSFGLAGVELITGKSKLELVRCESTFEEFCLKRNLSDNDITRATFETRLREYQNFLDGRSSLVSLLFNSGTDEIYNQLVGHPDFDTAYCDKDARKILEIMKTFIVVKVTSTTQHIDRRFVNFVIDNFLTPRGLLCFENPTDPSAGCQSMARSLFDEAGNVDNNKVYLYSMTQNGKTQHFMPLVWVSFFTRGCASVLFLRSDAQEYAGTVAAACKVCKVRGFVLSVMMLMICLVICQ